MKVVILAGGLGTRLSEETIFMPKPMVEIGGKPILWHIMKIYSYYGFYDFIILTGYKSHVIKDYFVNYYNRYSDITIDMLNNVVEIHNKRTEPWRVTILYTGLNTMTGSRIKKAQEYIKEKTFMLTYGDGLSDVNLNLLLKYHKEKGKVITLTAVKPAGRFGVLDISEDGIVRSFQEKSDKHESWINGGFMVCEPNIFDYIASDSDNIIFEKEPLEILAKEKQLSSYKHTGFWYPMDTLKAKNDLVNMWKNGTAPWAKWLQTD